MSLTTLDPLAPPQSSNVLMPLTDCGKISLSTEPPHRMCHDFRLFSGIRKHLWAVVFRDSAHYRQSISMTVYPRQTSPIHGGINHSFANKWTFSPQKQLWSSILPAYYEPMIY